MTNIFKNENNKKIFIAVFALLAVILLVLGMMKPKPQVKNHDLANNTQTTKKENLNDKYSLDFKKSETKKVASAKLPTVHKVPVKVTPKKPQPKALACGKMDPEIDNLIEQWKTNFTPNSIENHIGNALPQEVKAKLTNISNKRQLVDGVLYYLENNPNLNSLLSIEINSLKSAGNNESIIENTLLSIVHQITKKVPTNVTDWLLSTFKSQTAPLGWDAIRDAAAQKAIILPMTYIKGSCTDKSTAPIPPKAPEIKTDEAALAAAFNHNPGKTNEVCATISSSKIKTDGSGTYEEAPKSLTDKIQIWKEQFTIDNVNKAGIVPELPSTLITQIYKIQNKQDVINIVKAFLAASSDATLKATAKTVEAAGSDEVAIQNALMGAATTLMTSHQKTVNFIIKALMSPQDPNYVGGWDSIRDEFKAQGFTLPMNFGDCVKNSDLKLSKELNDKIQSWKDQFAPENVKSTGIEKELSSTLITQIYKIQNKQDVINIVKAFLAASSDATLKATATAVEAAGSDEVAIQNSLMGAATTLMTSHQKTVNFIKKALMSPQDPNYVGGWDSIRDYAISKGIHLPMNYLMIHNKSK